MSNDNPTREKKDEIAIQYVDRRTTRRHEVRVGSKTPTDALAGSITKFVTDGIMPDLIAIALPAMNQAWKGASKSKQHLAPLGIHIVWDICFCTREVYDERRGGPVSKTAMKLKSVILDL